MSTRSPSVLEDIRQIPVIDTHEHLENESMHTAKNILCDYTQHYLSSDLISSGLAPHLIPALSDDNLSILEKWNLLSPFWENCRHTGYGRALDLAVSLIYGFDQINRHTVEAINDEFLKLRSTKGYSTKLLKKHGIDTVINNIWRLDGNSENGFYRYVTQIDDYVMFNFDELRLDETKLEKMTGIQQWVEYCLEEIENDLIKRGAIAIKVALAYKRELLFEDAPLSLAEKGFQSIRKKSAGASPAHLKAAQDYVLHSILRLANDHGWILQVHTGYLEGNGGYISDTNPEKLSNLFNLYPNAHFDLFHMGYPYQAVLIALGKTFPNVRMNMCWTHILSPVAAKSSLYESLYTVPVNKLFAFGGDFRTFDGTIGHLEIARRNIAQVLSKCVEDGLFDKKRAIQIASKILYENPAEFYQV